MSEVTWRDRATLADAERARELGEATGVFTKEECGFAAEMAEENARLGNEDGYYVVLAESGGALVAFAGYGPIAGTQRRFDFYWLAVHPTWMGTRLARDLLTHVEAGTKRAGGAWLYIETSTTERYARARRFYEREGYALVATIPDYYRDGDGKVVYRKRLG